MQLAPSTCLCPAISRRLSPNSNTSLPDLPNTHHAPGQHHLRCIDSTYSWRTQPPIPVQADNSNVALRPSTCVSTGSKTPRPRRIRPIPCPLTFTVKYCISNLDICSWTKFSVFAAFVRDERASPASNRRKWVAWDDSGSGVVKT